MIITLIGIPKLLADMWVTQWWANGERWRGALAGVPIPLSRRRWRGDTILQRVRNAVTDPMTWRELVWLILMFGVGTASFIAGVTAFSIGLGFLTLPLWGWSLPEGVELGVTTIRSVGVDGRSSPRSPGRRWRCSAPGSCAAARSCQAKLAQVLLEGEEQERITELQVSRAGAVDAAAGELRRIERDLHDGAQARLVALAMEIGMAREQMASATPRPPPRCWPARTRTPRPRWSSCATSRAGSTRRSSPIAGSTRP